MKKLTFEEQELYNILKEKGLSDQQMLDELYKLKSENEDNVIIIETIEGLIRALKG